MPVGQVDRVVVGISGSLANLTALHAAVAHARRSGATLVAVKAWIPVGGELAYRRGPCPPLLEVWRQQARDTLDSAFADAFGGLPDDVAVQRDIVRGEGGPVLVAAAIRPGDLLVVGTGRRGRLVHLRPGSISRYCLAHARCPVLAVPQSEMIRDLRSDGHLRMDDLLTPRGPLSDDRRHAA
jgi:nucleotide-binding universal stress UspA family protein